MSSPASGALPGDSPPTTFTHRQIQVILIGLLSGMLLAALDQSIVGTALPRIVSDLGGLNHITWVVTAYLLTSTASTPLWGKISDLYGRRIIFQITIVIFLIGSALCGLAQSMPQLILFRAIQGIGGGGLMAIAFAIIGDVIPARERGRYSGYFGAVFGVSSLAGPLLGGWITDNISWRWIFYINLPVGLVALVVTSMVLKMPVIKREAKIDYLGATSIVTGVSSLLLYLNWAGERFGWMSPAALAFVAVFAAMVVAFIFIELRAAEPIIPMQLFKNPIFSVANAFGFLIGFALFGGAIYLPLYLQTVKGMSPTESGLAMLPMVVGTFSMSIISGQLITRTGKYKIYPIIGSVILLAALFLLNTLHVTTPYWQVAIFAFLFGVGLGLAMMTIITPVQNAVQPRDIGTATSATTFGRSLGGAIGAAFFGAVMTSRLAHYVAAIPEIAKGSLPVGEVNTNDMAAIHQLPEPLRTEVLTAFTSSVTDVFLYVMPVIALALVIVLFLKEIPLRTTAPILEQQREAAMADAVDPVVVERDQRGRSDDLAAALH